MKRENNKKTDRKRQEIKKSVCYKEKSRRESKTEQRKAMAMASRSSRAQPTEVRIQYVQFKEYIKLND